MGILDFDGGTDKITANVNATLGNIAAGAHTLAWGVRFDTLGARWSALGYLLASGVQKTGLSYSGSSTNFLIDVSTGFNFTTTESIDTNYVLVLRKVAGLNAPILSMFPAGGSWSHITSGNTMADQAACGTMELGVLTGSSDPLDGKMAFFAAWSGTMSQTDTEALVTNWRTSDLWTSAHGQPVCLMELNTTSVTDLAGNASSITVSGPTVDGAQTFTSWNFDGTGGGGPSQRFMWMP